MYCSNFKRVQRNSLLDKRCLSICPSVLLDRSIQVIVKFLQEDHGELRKRTKLNPTNIHQLLQLCSSECYFLYNKVIWMLQKLGPIGLLIVVILSECYLQRIEHLSKLQALTPNLALETFKRFADDSHPILNPLSSSPTKWSNTETICRL